MEESRKLTVYLAGPIQGCTDEECRGWRNRIKDDMPEINFLDPMRRDYRDKESIETAIDIVENDKDDIVNCDVVLAYAAFENRPSVGTSMEILYAFERGVYILTVAAMPKPLSPWLLYHSTKIVDTLEEAMDALREIAHQYSKHEVDSWGDEF